MKRASIIAALIATSLPLLANAQDKGTAPDDSAAQTKAAQSSEKLSNKKLQQKLLLADKKDSPQQEKVSPKELQRILLAPSKDKVQADPQTSQQLDPFVANVQRKDMWEKDYYVMYTRGGRKHFAQEVRNLSSRHYPSPPGNPWLAKAK